MAVRSSHHCHVHSDIVEPDDAVHPTSLDLPLAVQLHTKFEEERDNSFEVLDNNADVVHPQERHTPQRRGRAPPGLVVRGWANGTSTRFGAVMRWWVSDSVVVADGVQDLGEHAAGRG